MKIVLVGAGSFVFGPTVLLDAIFRRRIEGEVALVDINRESLEVMAKLGRRMAQDTGVRCHISTHEQWKTALPGADYVILSAAPEGARRWHMDYEVLQRAKIPDQDRECGGLGGLSYSLRTISLALDICEGMARVCPGALLLDVANPMPRVVTAIYRASSIRAFGFCNAAQRGAHDFDWLAAQVGKTPDQIQARVAGLNHFSWLLSLTDKATGADLIPALVSTLRQSADPDDRALVSWYDEYGAIAAAGAGHSSDFLPTKIRHSPLHHPPFHGNAAERQKRLMELSAMGSGEVNWRNVLSGGSWEHPVDLSWAIHSGETLTMPMLNLPNQAFLPDLPDGRIVETPVVVENGEVKGVRVGAFPGRLPALLKQVSDVHELVAEGAAKGRRDLLREAIAIDPAIPDKESALAALDELIALHLDILPRFR